MIKMHLACFEPVVDVVGHNGSGDGVVVALRWCWSCFRPGLVVVVIV